MTSTRPRIRRRPHLRSVLPSVLDEVLDRPAVDRIDEHEAPPARRLLGRVGEHPPSGSTQEAAPHLLRRCVTDRETERLLRADERLGLVEAHSRPGEDAVDPEDRDPDTADQQTIVDEGGFDRSGGDHSCHAHHHRGDCGNPAPRVVGESIVVGRESGVEVGREHIGVLVAGRLL
ncbi:MAG: hypothetical protein VW964_09975 [Ilumatobacter sp.]